MSRTLTSVADGADLILTGTTYQEVAANVAESQGIPLRTTFSRTAPTANCFRSPCRLR
jgi:hypothetical protein